MPGKLFCFDFDNTIVNGHMHNYMVDKWATDLNRPEHPSSKKDYNVQQFLREAGGIKNKAELEATMKHILSTGNKIAITSFSWFPQQIKEVLNTLDLRPYNANQIVVVPGYPSDTGEPTMMMKGGDPKHKDAKEQHIQKALRVTGMQGTHPRNVILIDDSIKNFAAARACDHQAIHVPAAKNPPPYYLKQARDIASVGPTEIFGARAQQTTQQGIPASITPATRSQANAGPPPKPPMKRTRRLPRAKQPTQPVPQQVVSSTPPIASIEPSGRERRIGTLPSAPSASSRERRIGRVPGPEARQLPTPPADPMKRPLPAPSPIAHAYQDGKSQSQGQQSNGQENRENKPSESPPTVAPRRNKKL